MREQDEAIHLVFAVDRAFLPYTAVAMESALAQTDEKIHLHVLQDGRLGREAKRLQRLVASHGAKLTFHEVDHSKLSHLPVTDHVSLATYYRLSIAELLPHDVHRVIYLDGDLIVRDDLGQLYRWPTGRTGVAAVPESSDSSQRLGMPADTPYFNAGVLVLDLDLWRRESVTDRLFEIAEKCREKLRFWDQDVLAIHLQGRFSQLPAQWNVTHRYFFAEATLPMPPRQPAIVHFSGAGLKPWNKGVDHPYAAEFWQLVQNVRRFGFRVKNPHRFRFSDRWRRRSGNQSVSGPQAA